MHQHQVHGHGPYSYSTLQRNANFKQQPGRAPALQLSSPSNPQLPGKSCQVSEVGMMDSKVPVVSV